MYYLAAYNLDYKERCHVVLNIMAIHPGNLLRPKNIYYYSCDKQEYLTTIVGGYPRISKTVFEERYGKLEYP